MRADTIYQQLRCHLAYLKLGRRGRRARTGAGSRRAGQARLHPVPARPARDRGRRAASNAASTAGCGSPGSPPTRRSSSSTSTAQPTLDRRLVEDLATLRFVEEKANCLLIGPPGVGKTHLAIALGHRAVHAGYRVYYTTAADLVARTSRAAMDGRWANTMRFWAGPQVLIVDELGYLPMPGEAASHLFQVISRRYEHGSIILTTNRGIADWGHDLRRHHRRDRRPRPPPPPRHRALRRPATATACAATATPSPRSDPPSPAVPQVGNSREAADDLRPLPGVD